MPCVPAAVWKPPLLGEGEYLWGKRSRLSSRAAQTARDLAGALTLPRYLMRLRQAAPTVYSVTQFACVGSLGVCAPRDDRVAQCESPPRTGVEALPQRGDCRSD